MASRIDVPVYGNETMTFTMGDHVSFRVSSPLAWPHVGNGSRHKKTQGRVMGFNIGASHLIVKSFRDNSLRSVNVYDASIVSYSNIAPIPTGEIVVLKRESIHGAQCDAPLDVEFAAPPGHSCGHDCPDH